MIQTNVSGRASAAGQASGLPSASRALVVLVVALFFIWGGITSLNDILIPKLKSLFQLSYTEAMLTQCAFFTGYFVFSIPAGILVARMGYLRGIVVGLAVMAAGCLLFIPATESGIYATFLGALFVVAAGITILQVAANPLITLLGDPKSAHSRLTLAQAFNSLGTAIMPYLGAKLILGSVAKVDPSTLSGEELAAFRIDGGAVIAHAYIGLAVALVLVAVVFWWRRRALGAQDAHEHVGLGGAFSLLSRPRLALGVTAIFFYVGAEVSIGSVMTNFLEQPSTLALDVKTAGEWIGFYWGGAMVGRFIGAALLKYFSPGKVLALAAVVAGILTSVAALATGVTAGWSLLAVGLFNSIMFPTIFSLAVEGLGEKTPQGSALLCMAIVGGALIPLLTGVVADNTALSIALFVPVACYVVIAGFGWYTRRG